MLTTAGRGRGPKNSPVPFLQSLLWSGGNSAAVSFLVLQVISSEEQSTITMVHLPTTLPQGGAEADVGNAQKLQRRPSKL